MQGKRNVWEDILPQSTDLPRVDEEIQVEVDDRILKINAMN